MEKVEQAQTFMNEFCGEAVPKDSDIRHWVSMIGVGVHDPDDGKYLRSRMGAYIDSIRAELAAAKAEVEGLKEMNAILLWRVKSKAKEPR
jgi:hypothetical protein